MLSESDATRNVRLKVAPRRPSANLLLNSDILNILAIINAFALEKLIKQINMKLFSVEIQGHIGHIV